MKLKEEGVTFVLGVRFDESGPVVSVEPVIMCSGRNHLGQGHSCSPSVRLLVNGGVCVCCVGYGAIEVGISI